MNFLEFNLGNEILDGISAMGFKTPTPIQEQAIPAIIEGSDLIACAQTGTGKTGAFLIPIIDKIIKQKGTEKINTLIIVPTRELAVQIDQQIEGLSYFTGTSNIAIYGGGTGSAFEQEKRALTEGADIIVATPGRLIMHLNQNYVDFSDLKHLILDEADRMLDMGFFEDLMKIVSKTSDKRQTLLFSATMPGRIRKLAGSILRNPVEITLAIFKPAEKINQQAYMVYEEQKPALFNHIMSENKPESVIVFTSSRAKVKEILKELKILKMHAKGISSDLDQKEREEVLNDFKGKKLGILVATDVLSRGIDIEGIEMVLNYDAPAEAEDYIHRIGRTARAGTKGTAITFVTPKDQQKLRKIERMLEKDIPKGTSPENIGATPEYSPGFKKDTDKSSFKKKRFHAQGNRNSKGRSNK